jgi:shikimate kinase
MVITLIGYRGTGKSTVGRAVAARLRWTCLDADEIVEERAGCTIRSIFAEQGEPAFRALEQETLAELLQGDRLIVAAGGGAVLHPPTRERMRAAGPVIWLQASLETILSRLAVDATTQERRPALTDLSERDEVARLLDVREPLYRETSTMIVGSDGRSPDDIADEIVARLPVAKDGP